MANLAFGIMYILPQFKNPHYKCKKTQCKNKQQYTQRQHKANLSVYIMPQWPISIIIPFLKERLRHGKRTEPILANCPLTSERVVICVHMHVHNCFKQENKTPNAYSMSRFTCVSYMHLPNSIRS